MIYNVNDVPCAAVECGCIEYIVLLLHVCGVQHVPQAYSTFNTGTGSEVAQPAVFSLAPPWIPAVLKICRNLLHQASIESPRTESKVASLWSAGNPPVKLYQIFQSFVRGNICT